MYQTVGCVFLFLFLISFSEAKELIWKYDTDISNPDNWINGKLGVNCKGLHFAEINSAPVHISRLTTAQIILAQDGILELDDGFIEFRDNKKCIQLKPIDYHNWYDPNSWRLTNENSAIPDKEKIPCKTDQVYFPNFYHTAISGLNQNNEYILGSKMNKTKSLEVISLKFNENSDCKDPYGCLCHDEFIFCREVEIKLKCSNPIFPEETCHEICGAYITYTPGQGPTLQSLNQKFKEFRSDTYASRVRNHLGDELIQIVFSEKEFTGTSLEEAEEFWKFLKNSQARNLEIYKSGYLESQGNSLGIIFGSLVFVLIIFGIIFYINGETKIDIFSRWNRRQGSIFSVPFFARFDNTDESLIIDGGDNGSILDIAKSFDNPMYGQTPSTSTNENPLYEATKDIEE